MWGMIATWRMAVEGITKGAEMLKDGGDAGDAVESAIREVEDFPYYKSVGYGGLPNEEMEVEMDAAFMDGNTLDIGAVAAIRDFANPVSIARRLSREKVNSLLVAEGAEKFAHKEGFERKNMLTDRAKAHYRKRLKEMSDQAALQEASGKLIRVGVKGILPQALFQTGLILAQLALNGRHGGVNGDKHIRGAFRHTDDGGAGTDGDFQVVPTLFHAEDDGGLGLGLEVAV